MRGKYLNIKINNTESEQIGIILGNHLLYDKSMKFGTYWEHDLRIILSKRQSQIWPLTFAAAFSSERKLLIKSSTLLFIVIWIIIHNKNML